MPDGGAELLQSLLIALGAGVGAVAVVVASFRVLAPLVSRLFGRYLETRKTLDADRDRIIMNLRSEIEDYRRRLDDLEERAGEAEARAARAESEVHDLNKFIDTLLRRLGTTREAVERGGPIRRPKI